MLVLSKACTTYWQAQVCMRRPSEVAAMREKGGLEGNHEDLLRPFKDYIIPGKEEGFIVMLREVLAIHQNTLGASTAIELNNLQTTIETLAKTVKEALPGPENISKKM
ncbi:hypothetical protein OIDMADRAFT_53940 [Oidiodendron maius Zn]|uniref:Uncharacterized protein n=1 Tax=Oidiodendron maius (strain Zn) TaxID=913774 RepID=A0A0C3DKB9_OIDMZ|nr:hypothetical protein OIDMADRAFT_53940 [Oidiodendron maius Zn]